MSEPPKLIDRAALRLHRARANTQDLFLHKAALDEVQDRLAMVKKTFTDIAIVTPFPQIWEQAFPKAVIVADDDTLALNEGAFDLVIHAMCLHWANDPVGQLIQCRRALRPDGLCLAVSLGGQTLNELRAALSQAEIDQTGGLSPRILPMPEIRDLGALLQRAGFALPVADNAVLNAEYRDIFHLMQDLRAMGETNALTDRLRHPTRRSVFAQAAALYQSHYATSSGKTRASFELISLTGWAPSESQPKPLRPGSAQARLADALGTHETKLPD
ncbi:methyltransferase domain-containing protein [Aestuariivita boseongensis]|uniref:methyltransferase domain-containing protein n=1 Tax=Aestuariivita boseongensis TaxID=1470562 RepID=UPI0006812A26|nr:methyltransferase domain-containing protein [Aestuariivita boseongensis]